MSQDQVKRGGMIGKLWMKFKDKPLGKWIFGKLICLKAPYFSTIKPKFYELEVGICRIGLKKRRAVLNHISTVHALAMGNLCELAAGSVIDRTLPSHFKWIPMGMRIDYKQKAKTDLIAEAKLDQLEFSDKSKVQVPVEVKDKKGEVVVTALIDMWVRE